jgi:hypothetical protein
LGDIHYVASSGCKIVVAALDVTKTPIDTIVPSKFATVKKYYLLGRTKVYL